MRIQKIEAENFKLFTTKFQEIENIEMADIVLLNGPNGYGKTSVFDVLEFCLTGEIKRIKKYSEELAIAKNETYDNKILISDGTKPAFVRIVLIENGETIKIEYFYTPKNKKKVASKENNPHKIFECFERKIICGEQEIKDQGVFLKNLQMEAFGEIFDKCCFLSQDEHLQFLKEAKKSKVESLSFLFEIPEEWEKEQKRVEALLDNLSNKRKRKDNSYIVRLTNEEENLKTAIQGLGSVIDDTQENSENQVSYQKLFEGKNIFWDQKDMSLDENAYKNSQEEIDNLIYFSEHKEECRDYLFNQPYQVLMKSYNGSAEISYLEYPLEYAFRFYGLVRQGEELEENYLKKKNYRELLKNIVEHKFELVNWKFIKTEELLTENDVEEIRKQLGNIKTLKDTQGIVTAAMSSLQQTRISLMKYAHTAMGHGKVSDSMCPLCGAPYGDSIELEKKIAEETELLNNLADVSTVQIQAIMDRLYTEYFEKVEEQIKRILQDSTSDEIYQKLQKVKSNKPHILDIERLLKKVGIFLPETYLDESEEREQNYNVLLEMLGSKLKIIPESVEGQLNVRKFVEAYDKFYDKEDEKYSIVSKDMLVQKREYIKFIHYSFIQKEMKKKETELKQIQSRKEQLESVKVELEKYQSALKDGIQKYKKKIIGDIEPLLYVYTAKILQQKFNGKSIFISTDEQVQDIQLVNSVTDKQDILYSMSSGQLSAVALSFLLCMNQVYGKQNMCSVLLIDDPIQTIDDVNMVGFVDILRYEFADRQIFISTHEQKFEWFLRYRYAKADKKVKVFNMKDIMLQEKNVG